MGQITRQLRVHGLSMLTEPSVDNRELQFQRGRGDDNRAAAHPTTESPFHPADDTRVGAIAG